MNESYLFDMKFNNIVFVGRNQAYGAYELRKDYNRHIITAALLATTLFAGALTWPLLVKENRLLEQSKKTKDNEKIVLLYDDHILPPPIDEPTPKEHVDLGVEKKIRTVRSTPPKIVKDSHAGPEELIPTVNELKDALIGTQNIDGDALSKIDLEGINALGNGTSMNDETAEAGTIFDYVADMPYFEGGEAGLMNFIGKKIRYPREAVQAQVEGIVVVSFVIDRNGKVTDSTILKSLGYGTDEEALRVINSLPDWRPGKQNGKPVAVRYTLPIRFSMQR